jgi:acetylornithine deacetylase
MFLSLAEKKVCDQIARMKEEIVQALQDLVRIPSVVGQEGKAQAYVDRLYRSLGLQVVSPAPDLAKVKTHPAFIETGMSYEGRANVIGIHEGDPGSRSLLLNGHIDVVSPEPSRAWKYDPWGAQIEGERMYGRGAGDMKAGLLANFFALKAILRAGLKPKGKVTLLSAIDEEAGPWPV